jgi:hypothetical protein
MALDGKFREVVVYVFAATILLYSIFRGVEAPAFQRLMLLFLFCSLLFLAFKAGFVRHDAHAVTSGTMILLSAALACTILKPKISTFVVISTGLAWVYIDANHVKTSTQNIIGNSVVNFASAIKGLTIRWNHPDALNLLYDSRISELREIAQIPLLGGSVDIYSYDQSYLIASGNEWSPRPIPQSYSVYTPYLSEKNRQHLLSRKSPKNILFQIQPIDNNLPSTEDGASWPVLLANYKLNPSSNSFLHLIQVRRDDVTPHALSHIEHKSYLLGEKISVPESNGLIFVRLKIQKKLLGRLVSLLYKPSQLGITLQTKSGTYFQYRLVSKMAEAGFLISPLVLSTQDFALLYSSQTTSDDRKIVSFNVKPLKWAFLWNDLMDAEFYSIAIPHPTTDLPNFDGGLADFTEKRIAPVR